ncbi:MAG: c-type cytochrome [Sandaracinaceae bacterium]
MLSKSAARAFFLGGTALCTVAFVALTVDTLGRLPDRTHTERLTGAVARGKQLWEDHNCMGCHTLFGEGAYYAPDLTQVYARRGPAFIRQMINDPQGVYPGERRMVDYDFDEQQLDDLVAFFEWCGHVDLNGFPAEPTIGPVVGRGVTDPRPEVFVQVCTACHAVRGVGGQVGPSLDGVAGRMTPAELTRWLDDPLAIDPESRMPDLPLTDDQIVDLVAYLSTLEDEALP